MIPKHPKVLANHATILFRMLPKPTLNKALKGMTGASKGNVQPKLVSVEFNQQTKLFDIKVGSKIIHHNITQEALTQAVKNIEKKLTEKQLNSLTHTEQVVKRQKFASSLEISLQNETPLLGAVLRTANQTYNHDISILSKSISVKYNVQNDTYDIAGTSPDGKPIDIKIPHAATKIIIANHHAKQAFDSLKDLPAEIVATLFKTKANDSMAGTITQVAFNNQNKLFEVSISLTNGEQKKFAIGKMVDLQNTIQQAKGLAKAPDQSQYQSIPVQPPQYQAIPNPTTWEQTPPAAQYVSLPADAAKVVLPPPPPAPSIVQGNSTAPAAFAFPPPPPPMPGAVAPPPKPLMKTNHQIAQELQEGFHGLNQRQLSQVLGLQKNDLLTRKPNLIQVKFKNPNFEISLKGSPEESITRTKKDLPKIRKALAQVNANKLDGLDNTDLSTDNASSTPLPAPSLTVASRVAAQLQKQQEQRSVIFSQKPDVLAQEFLRQLKGGLLSSIVSDYNKRENTNYNLRTSDLNVVYDSDKNKFKITGKSFYRGQDRTIWLSADEVRDAKVNPNKPSNEVQNTNVNPTPPIVETYASTAPIQTMEAAQQPYAQTPNNGQLQSGEGKNAYNSPATSHYDVPDVARQPALYDVPKFSAGAEQYKKIVLPDMATQQNAGVGVNTTQSQTAASIEPKDAPQTPYQQFSQKTNENRFGKFQDGANKPPDEKRPTAFTPAAASTRATTPTLAAASNATKIAPPKTQQNEAAKVGEGPRKPGGKAAW